MNEARRSAPESETPARTILELASIFLTQDDTWGFITSLIRDATLQKNSVICENWARSATSPKRVVTTDALERVEVRTRKGLDGLHEYRQNLLQGGVLQG